ncbi:MAG: hypothetical protein U1E19_10760 [Rhodoblastus sp.]
MSDEFSSSVRIECLTYGKPVARETGAVPFGRDYEITSRSDGMAAWKQAMLRPAKLLAGASSWGPDWIEPEATRRGCLLIVPAASPDQSERGIVAARIRFRSEGGEEASGRPYVQSSFWYIGAADWRRGYAEILSRLPHDLLAEPDGFAEGEEGVLPLVCAATELRLKPPPPASAATYAPPATAAIAAHCLAAGGEEQAGPFAYRRARLRGRSRLPGAVCRSIGASGSSATRRFRMHAFLRVQLQRSGARGRRHLHAFGFHRGGPGRRLGTTDEHAKEGAMRATSFPDSHQESSSWSRKVELPLSAIESDPQLDPLARFETRKAQSEQVGFGSRKAEPIKDRPVLGEWGEDAQIRHEYVAAAPPPPAASVAPRLFEPPRAPAAAAPLAASSHAERDWGYILANCSAADLLGHVAEALDCREIDVYDQPQFDEAGKVCILAALLGAKADITFSPVDLIEWAFKTCDWAARDPALEQQLRRARKEFEERVVRSFAVRGICLPAENTWLRMPVMQRIVDGHATQLVHFLSASKQLQERSLDETPRERLSDRDEFHVDLCMRSCRKVLTMLDEVDARPEIAKALQERFADMRKLVERWEQSTPRGWI